MNRLLRNVVTLACDFDFMNLSLSLCLGLFSSMVNGRELIFGMPLKLQRTSMIDFMHA